jgi:hypothetical protein
VKSLSLVRIRVPEPRTVRVALAAEHAVVPGGAGRHGDDRVAVEGDVPAREHVRGDVPGAGGGRRRRDDGEGGDRREGADGRCCPVGMAAHVVGDGRNVGR